MLNLKFISVTFVLFSIILSGCSVGGFTPIIRQKESSRIYSLNAPNEKISACEIFAREPSWYSALSEMQNYWGTPISLALAFVKHESSFIHNARPVKRNAKGVKIGYRSTAYGYSQALDGTWGDFMKVFPEMSDRTDFRHASHFIGWYTSLSKKELGLSFNQVSEHYLAYHEGRAGFSRGRHKCKNDLIAIADRVEKSADKYKEELKLCERYLKRAVKKKDIGYSL